MDGLCMKKTPIYTYYLRVSLMHVREVVYLQHKRYIVYGGRVTEVHVEGNSIGCVHVRGWGPHISPI